jgi:dihydrodipicolinate synthase/N-acetylneuraminate lyase
LSGRGGEAANKLFTGIASDALGSFRMLRGAIAAAVTPLADGGEALDEDAFDGLAAYLAGGGLDGMLALGTTGEGILLAADERRRAAELFLAARPDGFAVAVHCGAQTTRVTAELAAHAADAGADAVAVIGPPYFALDERALLRHFEAAAQACEPLPFYVYEFEARSGYAVPLPVLHELRERVSNLAGLKVSDKPWERFAPYLLEGLDVFVGPEALIGDGLAAGAAGAVSGLATVFPDAVARAVHERARSVAELERLRDGLERFPFHAAAKHALGRRGVRIHPYVRAPLRVLTGDEERELDEWLTSYV